MTAAPDLSALTLPELRALDRALRLAVAAAKVAGGDFDCALMADAEGVSVTFTVPVIPAGDVTTNLQP